MRQQHWTLNIKLDQVCTCKLLNWKRIKYAECLRPVWDTQRSWAILWSNFFSATKLPRHSTMNFPSANNRQTNTASSDTDDDIRFCIHHLIPEKRDESILSRLRNPSQYCIPLARTERFKRPFVLYALHSFPTDISEHFCDDFIDF